MFRRLIRHLSGGFIARPGFKNRRRMEAGGRSRLAVLDQRLWDLKAERGRRMGRPQLMMVWRRGVEGPFTLPHGRG